MNYDRRLAATLAALGITLETYDKAMRRPFGCRTVTRMPADLEIRRRVARDLRSRWGMSYPEIRHAMGLQSHSTALNYCRASGE